MKKLPLPLLALILLVSATGCSEPESSSVTLYSGRSQSLVQPLLDRFTEETGIQVNVRYGDTAQLAVALIEEGDESPADVYWAQDAGALGAVQKAGLFTPLPEAVTSRVLPGFAAGGGAWVATSGRARVLAWSPERLSPEDLPERIEELARPEFASRLGWAPTNGSFQAAVTAMRMALGDASTRDWLLAVKEGGATSYPNNRSILEGIANAEIDLGIPNHYYLYRYKADNPDYPVEQSFFAPGNSGNLINVAGIGHLASSNKTAESQALIAFLLENTAQNYFATETFEYPVTREATPGTQLADFDKLSELKPDVALEGMDDLEATLVMLREVGLL
ncbi:MAG: iron ABC transporter substrate-binding protein [Bacteroidetes bacterium CG12_big_fil_rev_8_21_14_0_65_60_17]|nr:MAG: iron ABC transporter substrate-binding protein [Bacteroidetes bacterium CG12_big_fil_rev_8_21_14_0_65_60_17]